MMLDGITDYLQKLTVPDHRQPLCSYRMLSWMIANNICTAATENESSNPAVARQKQMASPESGSLV